MNTLDTKNLEVQYADWKYGSIRVLDFTGQQLYVLGRMEDSDRLIIRDSKKRIIGSAGSQTTASRIDVETINSTGTSSRFEIQTPRIIGKSNTYISPAFDGREMVWKSKPMSSKIVYDLADENDMDLVHFESAGMSSDKVGKLQISEQCMQYQQDVMDEIMVALLSLVLHKLRVVDRNNNTIVVVS